MTPGGAKQHARLLSALHQEFLAHGLISTQDPSLLKPPSSGGFPQSATGAFPPLKYLDSEGREVIVRALVMFDDLIVNATVSVGSTLGKSAPTSRLAREGCGAGGGGDSSVLLSRRVTFEVPFWLEDENADRPQEESAEEENEQREQQQQQQSSSGRTSTSQAPEEDKREAYVHLGRSKGARQANVKDSFRARVLSGLLLHLCPPSGQFADLFGVEEGLRSRVLGMLRALDLATFGLTSRAAAMSVAADSLWASLVAAEFSEREQHAVLFPPSSPHVEPAVSANEFGAGGGENGGIDPTAETATAVSATAAAATVAASSRNDSADNLEKGARDLKSHSGHGGAVAGVDGSNSGGGYGDGYGRGREGASRRLYITLHNARARRAAIAAEQRRRHSILEMSALGRLGRAWGLYPWAPYLPRGPHYQHQYSPGLSFPEYNWGPGIGAGPTPDGPNMGAHAYPHPMWGSVGRWGSSRTSPWRGFGGGGAGGCPGGMVWSMPNQMGIPNAPPAQARRNRGRFTGHLSGL